MGLFKKKGKEVQDYTFRQYPHLRAVKPRERYVFHSDYFEIDTYYATIMSFFHTENAMDNFGPFWGINRIPMGLPEGVATVNFEQVRKMTEGWISEHQTRSESVSNMNSTEQEKSGTMKNKSKARRSRDDLEVIAEELNDGAAYLHVHYRLLVKAPTLEKLDEAVAKIERLYVDRFATLSAAPYPGDQKRELSQLFAQNSKKKGKGYYFTSTEFAGSYSLVTHGLEDAGGEYVGYMVGDVNNSAVLFDVDKYDHHIVVASEQYNENLGRAHISDMWGSKISQAALLNGHRVVHLILDNANMDKLGPKFDSFTSRIDLNHGDVNMFEMFGDVDDELVVFPQQMQKLILMAEQAYETTDSDRSIIRGYLEDVATEFYIDQGMWYEDAVHHRDKLRVVGIPHEEVPKLELFCSYLDTRYTSLINRQARDENVVKAVNILKTTFRNLLSNNGDLFNTTTKSNIDGARDGRRVIYDFSRLLLRGKGVAMAQFVNIIGFAIGCLGQGDVVIFHGAENIDKGIRNYVNTQLDYFYNKGGRVVFLYNDITKMLDDVDFNKFDTADYTIYGTMSDNIVKRYQTIMGQSIPADLAKLVTDKNNLVCYIRRGFDNVVFHQDLKLDPVRDGLNQGSRIRFKKRKRGGVT